MTTQKQALEAALKDANDPHACGLQKSTIALIEAALAEPCAMRYDFDGYGWKYIDSGSGSDWRTRIKDAEPVYAEAQPREWQELSQSEVRNIFSLHEETHNMLQDIGRVLSLDFNNVAKAISAALRAKNGG